ncbi:MAG: hypothetical protein ACHQ1D_09030 [Nitrososphaerales archaeon]
MRLYIRQKGHKYDFFENDIEEGILHGYWDNKRKIGLHSKILDKDNQELVTVTLTKAPAFWRMNKTTYRIQIHKENIDFEIKAVNAFKGHWTFELNGDKYDFYFHFGLKKSLYKNGNQVAKYDKGTVHIWNNDTGFIISNNDENKFLLLAIFLTFDMGENMGGDFNIDLGNLTGGVKEFNSNWQPVR